MKLVKLSEYFEIHNGVAKNNVIVKNVKEGNDFIPYIRPAQSYESSLDGYIDKNSVPQNKIFPQYTIYISTDGEGSHSYAYVSSFEFAPNSNVIALVEKIPLTITEKLFYAKCITSNRHKFSYARKPKQNRITNLLIPTKESIPAFVYKQKIRTISNKALNEGKVELDVRGWKNFGISNLFDIFTGGDKPSQYQKTGYIVNSVENLTTNNGIKEKIKFDSNKIYENFISVVSIGEGGRAFYQQEKSAIFTRVKAMMPKFELNVYRALFLVPIINLERIRYSYGRVVDADRLCNTQIKLPATPQGEPDWRFMENYIKSLPFSSSL